MAPDVLDGFRRPSSESTDAPSVSLGCNDLDSYLHVSVTPPYGSLCGITGRTPGWYAFGGGYRYKGFSVETYLCFPLYAHLHYYILLWERVTSGQRIPFQFCFVWHGVLCFVSRISFWCHFPGLFMSLCCLMLIRPDIVFRPWTCCSDPNHAISYIRGEIPWIGFGREC